eukprot:6862984-Pyramimonas_sp.AAC.1
MATATIALRTCTLSVSRLRQRGEPSSRSGFASTSRVVPSVTSKRTTRRVVGVQCSSKLTLYGHPGTRSPLIDWYLHELEVVFDFKMPSEPGNPHPFGQVPALTDEGGVEVFESGAILLYIADKYGGL